jgi:pyridoxal phosphate enzyme (YggS family)
MGVSKFFPRSAVEEAKTAGLVLFGESRVQEAETKFPDLVESNIELHLIGSLQRNKVKRALALFSMIESVDRNELIDELGKLTAEQEKTLKVLLELNSGEVQKAGFRSEPELFEAMEKIALYRGLNVCGLMTIAPNTEDKKIVRKAFRRLAIIRQKIAKDFPQYDFSILSMGMSGDYTIAIEEGSTLIRVGTAIFGERF